MPPALFRTTFCVTVLGLASPAFSQDPPPGRPAEESAPAERVSMRHPSDHGYGQEVLDTLAKLLPEDPGQAQACFRNARVQVAAERAAKTTSEPGEGGDRLRSVSALGAALGGAVQRVENRIQPGDPRLPGIIGAVTAMLAADEGCGVEGCESVRFHVGVMMHKAATAEDGTFHVQSLVEKLGPLVKDSDLPVLLGAARHMTWGLMRDDEAGLQWLAGQAANGERRDLARLLLAAARISRTEHDAGNQPRAGLQDRTKLPEEQLWLLDMLEKKSVPPAALAACGADILREWPTAEAPLRYACARSLADAWASDVPVNLVEAGQILASLLELLKDGQAPQDEGFAPCVQALAAGWEKRLERNRTPLYGWPAVEIHNDWLTGRLFLLCRAHQPEAAERLLTFSLEEAARDRTLTNAVRLSEAFHIHRLYPEAARIIASITPGQLADPAVNADRRTHISIKRYHVPLDAASASGKDAAVKATIALLKEKNDDPAAWTGAAWSWWIGARDCQADGENEEAMLRWCMSCVLAHAADQLAHETHGSYQPPAEGKCREELKARNRSPDRVRLLRTKEGVQMLLDAFDGAWSDLPAEVKERLMDGAQAK